MNATFFDANGTYFHMKMMSIEYTTDQMDQLYGAFDAMGKETNRYKKFNILSEHMEVLYRLVSSEIYTVSPAAIEFMEELNKIFLWAVDNFPAHLPPSKCEMFAINSKKIQDAISLIIKRINKEKLLPLGPDLELYSQAYSCLDVFILRTMYLFCEFKHPDTQMTEDYDDLHPDLQLLRRLRKIFYYYVSVGSLAAVPSVYTHLVKYNEVHDFIFLKNCRLGVYERKINRKCQSCPEEVGIAGADYGIMGICGHLMCIGCCNKDSVTKYAVKCMICRRTPSIWIMNSHAQKHWRISELAVKLMKILDIPSDWYSVVPEPFFEVEFTEEHKKKVTSFGVMGYFGSLECLKMPKILTRDVENLEEHFIQEEARIRRKAVIIKSFPCFKEQHIIFQK